jgi:hypothetical protein
MFDERVPPFDLFLIKTCEYGRRSRRFSCRQHGHFALWSMVDFRRIRSYVKIILRKQPNSFNFGVAN